MKNPSERRPQSCFPLPLNILSSAASLPHVLFSGFWRHFREFTYPPSTFSCLTEHCYVLLVVFESFKPSLVLVERKTDCLRLHCCKRRTQSQVDGSPSPGCCVGGRWESCYILTPHPTHPPTPRLTVPICPLFTSVSTVILFLYWTLTPRWCMNL